MAIQSNAETISPELEVERALIALKVALIDVNYRNWWHRFSCWLGSRQARTADIVLNVAFNHAIAVVNRSPLHQAAARVISARQPDHVRDRDNFLALIH